MYVAMDTQSERWELRRGLLFAPLTILKELIIIFSSPRLVYTAAYRNNTHYKTSVPEA